MHQTELQNTVRKINVLCSTVVVSGCVFVSSIWTQQHTSTRWWGLVLYICHIGWKSTMRLKVNNGRMAGYTLFCGWFFFFLMKNPLTLFSAETDSSWNPSPFIIQMGFEVFPCGQCLVSKDFASDFIWFNQVNSLYSYKAQQNVSKDFSRDPGYFGSSEKLSVLIVAA